MSSTVCRCYDGSACPLSAAGADAFFREIGPDDLSNAAKEAVSDYVELRGLNGLCPDVRKWGPPPSPAAFLDAGLPKTRGVGSLPLGLSPNSGLSALEGGTLRGCVGSKKGRVKSRRTTSKQIGSVNVEKAIGSCNSKEEEEEDDGNTNCNGISRFPHTRDSSSSNGGHFRRRSSRGIQPDGSSRRNSVDSYNSSSSIPPPTWEEVGPEGFVSQEEQRWWVVGKKDETIEVDPRELAHQSNHRSLGTGGVQVLSFETLPAGSSLEVGSDEDETARKRGLSGTEHNYGSPAGKACWSFVESSSAPELRRGGANEAARSLDGDRTLISGKQLLFALSQEASPTRSCRSPNDANRSNNRGRAQTARPSKANRRHLGERNESRTESTCPGGRSHFPHFSPPDDWDDSGVFTVAPRPKTVHLSTARRRDRRQLQEPGPAKSASESKLSKTQVVSLPSSLESLMGSSVIRNFSTSDLWRKGQDFRKSSTYDGVGLWKRRRRKVGGGGGDEALEFLDVREAALVSVAESLSRKALPWQAQLCPRALQDLEIARVRAFYSSERRRQEAFKNRQDEIFRGQLTGEERSWGLFGRAQGDRFESTLRKTARDVKELERDLEADISKRSKRRDGRVQREKGFRLHSINAFEQSEADNILLFRRSVQLDLLWDPPASVSTVQQMHQERLAAAREAWSKGYDWSRARLDSSIWLEEVGAKARASEGHARWRRWVREIFTDDERRAEAERAEERSLSSARYSSLLEMMCKSEENEKRGSEEAWDLQGWLAVGSHKLVQQTLRAFVRTCSSSRAVRTVLWEARHAAEFAAAARETAASQRKQNSQVFCGVRSERKKMIREHKRNMFEVEERRAGSEDAERNRAAHHIGETLLNSSATVKRESIFAHAERERTKLLSAMDAEKDTCELFRSEMLRLQHELDRETERAASSLRIRREEEEEQMRAEVSLATSSLEEEKARADDREVLLRETLLTESDKEDSVLKAWLLRQKQENDAVVEREVSQAQTRLEKDRERWVKNVVRSIAEVAVLDASFFRNSLSWNIGKGSSNSVRAQIPEQENTVQDSHAEDNSNECRSEKLGWASLRVRIPVCNDDGSQVGNSCVSTVAQGEQNGVLASTSASLQPHGTTKGYQDNRNTNSNVEQEALTEEVERECLAAQKRCARIEALAGLAHAGLAAHWKAFFRDEIERTRMAAAAVDMAAERWVQRQRETFEVLWASWRGREWQAMSPADIDSSVSASACVGPSSMERGTAIRGGFIDASNEAPNGGIAVAAMAAASPRMEANTNRDSSKVDEGVTQSTKATVERVTVLGGGSNAGVVETVGPQTPSRGIETDPRVECASQAMNDQRTEELESSVIEPSEGNSCVQRSDSHDAESSCVVVPRNTGNHTSKSQQRSSGDAETKPGKHLLVFVGKTMAVHLSTIRTSYLEYFHEENRRRYSSSFSLPPPNEQQENRVTCAVSSVDETDESPEYRKEFEWLRVMENIARDNTEVDLAVIGSMFGALPGGAAVLCLAHDSLVEDSDEKQGLVRTDILLSAVSAFITLRRSVRAGAAAAGTDNQKLLESENEISKPAEVTTEESEQGSVISRPQECGNRCSSATITSTTITVAEVEVAAELDVYGDELCADLARIFVEFPSPSACIGGVGDGECSPESQAQLQTVQNFSLTSRVACAVKKHSALLSPQSICALTALLRAKSEEGGADRYNRHRSDGRHDHRSYKDSSSAGDLTLWRTRLTDALVAVRSVSLDHAAMWVAACDPGKLESAYLKELFMGRTESVSQAVQSPMEEGTGGATTADDGGEEQVVAATDSGGGVAGMWAAMHKLSGLGLSPLVALATALSENENYSSRDQTLSGASGALYRKAAADHNSTGLDSNCSRAVHGGGNDVRSGCLGNNNEVSLMKTATRSVLRLLSSTSLLNVARCLERSPRHRTVERSLGRRNVGILQDLPGHPSIGDLSRLDEETLRRGAERVMMALDAKGTGALPPAALAVALQSGEAGFRLETLQANIILRLAGCLDSGNQQPPGPDNQEGGGYCYLGYHPRSRSVRYGLLLVKLPGLLRLSQAAYRMDKAGSSITSMADLQDMSCGALEQARKGRFRSGIQRHFAAFVTSLEAVCQRMAYTRLQRRSSLLEAPRVEAMRQLAEKVRKSASDAEKKWRVENVRREEVRREFATAQKTRIAVTSSTGPLMLDLGRARAAATNELCEMGARATEQARERLTWAVERLSAIMDDAEQELIRDEQSMKKEVYQAPELREEEPTWWGEGLTQEVEKSYRHEAMAARNAAGKALEEARTLSEDMRATLEDDVRACEGSLAETQKRLEIVMAEFEERRSAPQDGVFGEAEEESPSRRSSSFPQSDEHLVHPVELLETSRHRVSFCQESLAWLDRAASDLGAQTAELCERCAALPSRAEQRLSAILRTAEAKRFEMHSTVAKRLHEKSKTWGEAIVEREHRWGKIRGSRRASFEKAHADLEVSKELSGRLGPVARAARTVVLEQALDMAREPVRSFLETALSGPLATRAIETGDAAATSFAVAHNAVQRIMTASGARAAAAGAGPGPLKKPPFVEGEEMRCGPVQKASPGDKEHEKDGDQNGLKGGELNMNHSIHDCSSPEVAAGAKVLAMERKDSSVRMSACQEAIEGWWERQRAAMEEGLRIREEEASDRRTKREVRHLLSETLVPEIEAQDQADCRREQTLSIVLSEAKQITEQLVDALRSASSRVDDAAVKAQTEVAEEGEVLLLQAQSLSTKVSATLQGGLKTATDDLAAAQRQNIECGSPERGDVGEGVTIEEVNTCAVENIAVEGDGEYDENLENVAAEGHGEYVENVESIAVEGDGEYIENVESVAVEGDRENDENVDCVYGIEKGRAVAEAGEG